ncbi:hypothetical protein HN958_03920 [Candidatus Falkowbacteria bacterium]|jgi:hypothetical protein|nr:hypothetical protein [Candidatus Falkowbacteria bacterium]MBT7007625.1 hypothetical protein [Candidatus Falkowbacteria bacterium]
MYLLQKIYLGFVSAFWLAGILFIKDSFQWWWLFLLIQLVLLLLSVFVINKYKFKGNFIQFVILPIAFCLASFLFLVFIVNGYIYNLVTIFSAFVLYYLLRQYYTYSYFPQKYQPYSLESLSSYIVIITSFFLFLSLFAFLALLNIDLFLLLLFLIIVLGLICYYYFWINKINLKKSAVFVFVIVLVISELFVAVSYLPTGYFVNGFILAVVFTLMLQFSKAFLFTLITKKFVISHLSVASIILLIVMFTAQWS